MLIDDSKSVVATYNGSEAHAVKYIKCSNMMMEYHIENSLKSYVRIDYFVILSKDA